MTISATIQNRDSTDRIEQNWDTLEVERYDKDALFGPKSARLRATGSSMDVWKFLNMLRCPVIIRDDELGKPQWWGFIHDIVINDGANTFGLSLDTMANNVSVAYTNEYHRYTTDWSENTISSDEYGQKDNRISSSEVSEAKALQRRDTELERRKFPTIQFRGGASNTSSFVTINCRGWDDTLEWPYYENALGLESYETSGPGVREIGEDDRPIAAMSFQLSSAAGWSATSVWVKCYKKGTPAVNLNVSLYSDSAGKPNAQLATCAIAGADIPTSSTWTEFTMGSAVALSTGTTYWIHVEKSGAISLTDYFVVETNKDLGYESGGLYLYSTIESDWVERNAKGDMNFKVIGKISTTDQITNLITNVGEFIVSTTIQDASGVTSDPNRDGDTTALKELIKLLEAGTTNDRRLLAPISINRIMTVKQEPLPQSIDGSYKLDSDGRLLGANDQLVPETDCVVGEWAYLKDVIPNTVDVTLVATPSPFFIEEAEYTPRNGYKIKRVRDQRDVFIIGGVTQG